MSRKISSILRVVVFAVILLANTTTLVFAQGGTGPYVVKVVQVDTTGYPTIGVWVSVADAQGNPVRFLPSSAFALLENGQPVTIMNVSQSGEQKGEAINVVLTIDRSASMGYRGKMEAAKAAATAFVDLMRSEDATGIVAFDTQVQVVHPLTSDKTALHQAIASIQARGNTAMYDGLASSVEVLSGAQGRRAIILLSDGLDNRSRHTAGTILNTVQSSGLSIYAIGLGDPSLRTGSVAGIDEASLRAIAERSRGAYTYASDPQGLSRLYEQLARELQNEYYVTYVTSNKLRDGLERGIAVQVAGVGNVQSIYNPGGVIPETADASAWWVFGLLLMGLVGLLFLPGLLRRLDSSGKSIGLARRKGRIKLAGSEMGQKQVSKPQSTAKPRVRIQGKGD